MAAWPPAGCASTESRWSRAACSAPSATIWPPVRNSWPPSLDLETTTISIGHAGETDMQTLRTKRRDVSGEPDSDLVALVLAGDGTAFAAIMTRYNQRLFRVARGVVRDEAEAEDVLQEAYVRAFAALAGFRGDAGLGTWLTRIGLNEALGRMRRRRPTEQLEVIDQDAQTGDSRVVMFPGVNATSSPEAAAACSEVRRLLERAIDDLPEVFRLVFVMRDI